MAKFKVTIEGDSPKELRESMREYLGIKNDADPYPAEEQEDFLTQAAAQGSATIETFSTQPTVPAAEDRRNDSRPKGPIVPPPPSVSIAEKPIAPAGTVASNDFGLDSKGMPWDERIHSVTQAKNKDGSWRYKRGVEQGTVQMVEAERRGTSPAAPAAPAVVPPLQPSSPVAPAAPLVPPNIPMPPPEPAVPHAHSLATFKATLVPTLAKLVKEGKLTQDYIQTLCAHFQIDMIFKANDQQLAEMFNEFVKHKIIVKAE